ncbi:glycosyltransferase [Methylobacterium oryzihabitans]|nr:glycosyltransferase family 2 protein [Methylobacterium oryzihabitans]
MKSVPMVPAPRYGAPMMARPFRAVVAIPVRNEAQRIGACLDALARQDGLGGRTLGLVLFLNNCTDATAAVVAARADVPGLAVRVVAQDFAGAHAGWARREAMEAAASWLEEGGGADGVILTTDADSRVPPDWVALNLAAIDAGADAVAGRIALNPDEAARLPARLHARGRLEGAYEVLLDELAARLDPLPHDPWPNHATASGATLAVRLDAYRAAGGLPALPVGEDRAFVAALLARDARLRHAPEITVVTSGRLDGRAPGGAAETMRRRCEDPASPCDPRLEPPWRALLRLAVRRRLRRWHAAGRIGRVPAWAPWLGLRAGAAREIAQLGTAGAVIAAVEAASPLLAPRPLSPPALPGAIRTARAVLRLLGEVERLRDRFAAARSRSPEPTPEALAVGLVPARAPEATRAAEPAGHV